MGIGDALMAAGEARLIHQRTGRKVCIVGRDGRVQRSDVFLGNPYIVQVPARGVERYVSGSGYRPYIAVKSIDQWAWQPYTPKPAEMFFTPAEEAFGALHAGDVMIEPHGKAIGHRNKVWDFDRWELVAAALVAEGVRVVQCGARGTPRLDRAEFIETRSFRQAAAVMRHCQVFAGGEGGLMHAAAAVGTPAVILWSHFISPEVTGYASHTNIRHAQGIGCGKRTDCPECRASLNAIAPAEAVVSIFNRLTIVRDK